MKTNEFGQKELNAREAKNLFFEDLRVIKNLLQVKYMKVRNEGRLGSPKIVFDHTPDEAYVLFKEDFGGALHDAAAVAVAQLRKEYK